MSTNNPRSIHVGKHVEALSQSAFFNHKCMIWKDRFGKAIVEHIGSSTASD